MDGMRDIRGATVVITGASSGIGRASALAFAREGANLALAARRGDALEEVRRACEALGAQAIVSALDVADAAAVEALAEAAVARFGRIDVWINNAGVGVIGAFEEAPLDLHRRTIDTNLIGGLNGSYAAMRRFVAQGRGVLINNISLGGFAPAPYAAAYTASKFGLRGLTASLRQEAAAHPGVAVCGVFPAIIDTPGLAHGANQSGRRIDAGPLIYPAEDVAQTFVSLVRSPRAETAVGWPARAAQIGHGLFPRLVERMTGAVARAAMRRAGPAPRTRGALLAPMPEGRSVDGGWLKRKGLPPAGTVTKLALGGLGAVALLAIRAGGRPRRRF